MILPTETSTMSMVKKLARPISFLAFVNMVLAGDIVMGINAGHVNIASWSSLMQWATPVHVLATILVIGFAYFPIEFIIKYYVERIVIYLPGVTTLLRVDEHCEKEYSREISRFYIHKEKLKTLAMKQNNAVVLKLWQEANRYDNQMRDAARHLTVFFLLVILDGYYGGPFISSVNNLSWWALDFWSIYALMLAFYVYVSVHMESSYVYFEPLEIADHNNLSPTPHTDEPLNQVDMPKASS